MNNMIFPAAQQHFCFLPRTTIPKKSLIVTIKIYQNHSTSLRYFLVPHHLSHRQPPYPRHVFPDWCGRHYSQLDQRVCVEAIPHIHLERQKVRGESREGRRLERYGQDTPLGHALHDRSRLCLGEFVPVPFPEVAVGLEYTDQRSASSHFSLALITLFSSRPVKTSSLRPGDQFGQQSWPLHCGSARHDIWRTSGLPKLVCPSSTNTMPRSSRAWRLSDSWMFSQSGGE